MTIELTSSFLDVIHPARLLGPIFNKELRVCSRRRRNYVLRCVYIAALSVFILYAWYAIAGARSASSAIYQTSRSAQVGRTVIAYIVWFQFVVTQLIAIVMLSSCISDEIRTGTLAVLMTTPIRSFQIVTGKLLSRLLQLILLLAISLPLLAIVRGFGGVTWAFVISSVCITLTASVLAGALSLWMSLNYRHAHIVIVVTILFYLVIFGALPGLCNVLAVSRFFFFSRDVTQAILALTNPFWAFAAANVKFLFQSRVPRSFSWPLHCLITLVLAAFVLALSIRRVRKAALGEAFGETAKQRSRRTSKQKVRTYIGRIRYQPIRPVMGQPIVWKEMRTAILGRGKEKNAMFVLFVGAFVMLVIIILFTGIISQVNVAGRIVPYLLMSAFYLMTMIRLAVFSAGSITTEKEAQTWPILLTTPLADSEIVRGKAVAAFRRNIPLILAYFGLLCLSYIGLSTLGRGDWLVHTLRSLVLSACSIVGSVFFVIGSGIYFGVRLKTTIVAVAATIGLYLGMTYFLCGMFNPLRLLAYRSIGRHGPSYVFYSIPVIYALIQAGIGIAFARLAIHRLRRNVF
jgi:ABC-type transport system involved in multi-copper enzyme maturation permease subunit